ncbi:hypothetical protein PV10_06910 [Exophiala mesophila]|uniref:Guanylate cyclase domain-containing protein n=1 Tax=Exophiala mesophila TaxID=212818 RepID=A0A0D1Z458_EXOME|nr:uncharacterized protein PV10_06910 [Exophiala mesophila]KIV89517.1 hypothetical protein PV10_06910 [Exophiala mesophila]
MLAQRGPALSGVYKLLENKPKTRYLVILRQPRCTSAVKSRTFGSRTLPCAPCSGNNSRFSTTTIRFQHQASHRSNPSPLRNKTEQNKPDSSTDSDNSKPSTSSLTPQATSIDPPTGHLSIVFTDIVKSTAIWETNTEAMVQAMHIHDTAIRTHMAINQGYEVKQNGDGFMLAFPTATMAVQFCLDVQEQLLDEAWPKGILKLAHGKVSTDEQGHVLFRGLKLRISAHWGEPVCAWNEVIHRMDYLGPMVNRAARFIEVTEAGQVVVSRDLVTQLQYELGVSHGLDSKHHTATEEEAVPTELSLPKLSSNAVQDKLTHQQFEIRALGDHNFRGLKHPESLYFIVPRSLEGRVNHWHQVKHVSGVKGNIRSKGG